MRSGEFSLVNETLNTPDCVKACVVMIRKINPTAESIADGETTEKPFPELMGLLDLGQGVNGYPGTVHGGFFNVILDEVMGSSVNVYKGKCLHRISPSAVVELHIWNWAEECKRTANRTHRGDGIHGVFERKIQETAANTTGGNYARTSQKG